MERLPKLTPVDKSKKRLLYKLKEPSDVREKALLAGVASEAKRLKITQKEAALKKKGRLNILRIYRRNKKKTECRTITRDMRFLDKKFKLGETASIC